MFAAIVTHPPVRAMTGELTTSRERFFDLRDGLRMDKDELSENAVEALLTGRQSSARTINSLVCLNFKVPLRVRQQFKIYAVRHNMTMTELLLRLLDDCLTSDASRDQPNTLTKQEIKK